MATVYKKTKKSAFSLSKVKFLAKIDYLSKLMLKLNGLK